MDGLLRDGHNVPSRLHRWQGGGGVMFWAEILRSEMINLFSVDVLKVSK